MTEPGIAWTFTPTARSDVGRKKVVKQQAAMLARSPLFHDLSRTHLRQLAEASAFRRVRAGQELVKEGVPGSVFYVILTGTAKVTKGGRTLKRLGPNDFFGEMSILTKTPRSASVVAETQMECLTLSASGLRTVMNREPTIAVRLLATLAERLAAMDRRIEV
jgi:CRP/FNR family transcriptional regulator, cyclic AMP receptor protein